VNTNSAISRHHVGTVRPNEISLGIVPYRQSAFACLLLCGLAMVCGCGSSNKSEVVHASGTVQYEGQPLTNGTVMFNPENPQTGRVAQSEIKPDGTFALSTVAPGDGAVPGSYTVSVTSTVPGSEPIAKDKGTGVGGKSAIPAKYNNPTTSKLKEKIESGKPRTDIQLKLVN